MVLSLAKVWVWTNETGKSSKLQNPILNYQTLLWRVFIFLQFDRMNNDAEEHQIPNKDAHA